MGGSRAAALAGLCVIAVAGCGGDEAQPTPKRPVAAAIKPPAAVADQPAAAAKPRPIADNAEADQSFATADDARLTKTPPRPGTVGKAAAVLSQADLVSPGAPSDAQIARELKEMDAAAASSGNGSPRRSGGTKLESDGTVTPGPGVPDVVKRVIAGANAIAKFPYVYGGGHGSFTDTAYDCSGSLSYALAAGGLLDAPKTSGDLARTGKKGPGKWITIYANAGHTFMTVDGVRFDTSGRGGPLGTRWNANSRSTAGLKVTHPPGL